MNAKDRKRLNTGEFDKEAWAELWDRLPQRARRSTLEFILHKLHAIESGGQWSMSWYYESSEMREESCHRAVDMPPWPGGIQQPGL